MSFVLNSRHLNTLVGYNKVLKELVSKENNAVASEEDRSEKIRLHQLS